MLPLLRSRLLPGRLVGRLAPVHRSVKPFNTYATTIVNDQPSRKSLPRQFLKFVSIAALTGAVGATAYASYAYSLDEVEKKATTLREGLKVPEVHNASGFDKYLSFAYAEAMQVPLKAIELYTDARRYIEEQIRIFAEPTSEKLLPDLNPLMKDAFTLVLDLNETLIFSDWKRERGWRTFKRPGVEAFLQHLSQYYEIVVYSDMLHMNADPVVGRLDNERGWISYNLSRAATKYENGKHYRDLSKLNREPSRMIYISGNPESTLQHENLVYVKPWKRENDDTALLDLIPFLEYVASHRPADIRAVLASYQGCDNIPAEFIKRHKEHERRMQEKPRRSSFWR